MPDNDSLTTDDVRLTQPLFGLPARAPVTPPRKALILQPAGLAGVMLATPMLAALATAFPEAQFDWLVRADAAAAIAGNPRLRRLIRFDTDEPASDLAERLQQEQYDTCFLPDAARAWSAVARQAGIAQRIGLPESGRGRDLTLVAKPPATWQHRAARNLALAAAADADDMRLQAAEAEFYPSDADRTAVTRWLVEDLDWLGDRPLVMLHPGGVDELPGSPQKRWPAVRYARLANHLGRAHDARIILVGGPTDQGLAAEVAGMMAMPVANQVGRMGLGEMGALGEIAGLYVGNDAGPTHVAAAAGCPTLVIFGPTDPAVSAPYTRRTAVDTLWQPPTGGSFSWDDGVSVDQAAAAADRLLAA